MVWGRETADRLARLALEKFGMGQTYTARLLQISENITYLVQHRQDAARKAVLRINRPGYHTVAELAGEIDWMRAIRAETPLIVPRPIPAPDGTYVQQLSDPQTGAACSCVLCEFLTGQPPDETDEENEIRCFRRLGESTACLHNQARSWAGAGRVERFTWDCDTMIGDDGRWGGWKAAPELTPEMTATLERARRIIRRRLGDYGRGPERFGLIHADLRLSNLLVEGDAIKIIDFDDCGFGWFLHDLAAAVSFIETQPATPRLIEAWLEGYEKAGRLTGADFAQIDTFVMQRRMQLLAWLSSHTGSHAVEQLNRGFAEGTAALAQRYLTRYA